MNQPLLLSVLASLSDSIHHMRYAIISNQDEAIAKDLDKAIEELIRAHVKLSRLCDENPKQEDVACQS